MWYSVDRKGWVLVFNELLEAEQLEWIDVVENSEYLIVDDGGFVYEQYPSGEGFCGYKLRATDIRLHEALEVLRRHSDGDKLGSEELCAVEAAMIANGLYR